MFGCLIIYMKFILGKKKEMTQIFAEDGKVIPVTKILTGPCYISAIKKKDKDGYEAVQLVFGPKKKGKKPQKGQFKGIADSSFFQYAREFRVPDGDKVLENLKKGQKITVDLFEKGEKVKITGTSKGKGFQGVVKRHGFSGSPKTHGHKDQLRMPGSIGATGPAHVFKGMKMPGQMGGGQVAIDNIEIADVDAENNVLYVKGALPGAENGLLLIKNKAEYKMPEKKKEEKPEAEEEKKPEKKEKTEQEKPESKEQEKKQDQPEGAKDKKPAPAAENDKK